MDRSSKYLFWIIFILFCVTVGYRFNQYMIKKNFVLKVNITCDPNLESCFKADCDSTSPDCDTSTYKKVSLIAHDAPKCLEEHNCESFSCSGLNKCEIANCSKDSLETGEICTK